MDELAVLEIFDRFRARALEQDAGGECAGDHGQVGTLERWAQESDGGGAAAAVADGVLAAADAFLLGGVVVLGMGIAGLLGGLDPGIEQRVLCPRIFGAERSGARSEEHTSELQSLMRIS